MKIDLPTTRAAEDELTTKEENVRDTRNPPVIQGLVQVLLAPSVKRQ